MPHKAERFIDRLPLVGKYLLQPALKGYIKSDLGHEKRKFTGISALLGAYVLVHAYQAKLGVNAFSNHAEHFETTGDTTDTLFMGIDAVYAAVNAAVTLRQASLMRTANQIRHRRYIRSERLQTQLRDRAQTLDLRLSDEAPEPLIFPSQDLRLSDEAPKLLVTPTQDIRLSEFAPQSVIAPEDSDAKEAASETPFYKRKLAAFATATLVTFGGQTAMADSYVDSLFDHWDDTCIAEATQDIAARELISGATVSRLESLQKEWVDYCGVGPSDITLPSSNLQNVVATTQP